MGQDPAPGHIDGRGGGQVSNELNAGRLLRDMLCLLGGTALAWGFHYSARIVPTPWLIVAWVLCTALIGAALLRRARIRRRAFITVYVAAASPMQGWLRGGLLLALRPALLAAVLALLLLVALARVSDPRVWLALIGSVPVLAIMRAWLHGWLSAHAGPLYLPILSWRLAALLVGSALTLMFVLLAYHQSYPDLAAVSLERAVWHLVDQEQARSPLAQLLLQVAAAMDGLRLWLAQQLMPAPATSLVQGLGWLLVLAEEGLFVWSYLLLGHGILIGAGSLDRTGP